MSLDRACSGVFKHTSSMLRFGWRWAGSFIILSVILSLQAYAFFTHFALSLGPQVILQPWLLRQGHVLYQQMLDEHGPGMSLIMTALTYLQPDGLLLSKSTLVALITLTTMLVWLSGRRVWGEWGGLFAAVIFVVWSPVFFYKLWHETFLSALYVLMLLAYPLPAPGYSRRRFFLLGIIGGCAILVKQHALAVVGGMAAWHVFSTWLERGSLRALPGELSSWAAGGVLPLALYGAFYWQQGGNWEGIWYSLVLLRLESKFIELASQAPQWPQVEIVAWACATLPVAFARMLGFRRRKDSLWQAYGLGFVVLLTSALTAFPRFAFFHLQASLPVLAWLSTAALMPRPAVGTTRRARELFRKQPPAGAALVIVGLWLLYPGSGYRVVIEPDRAQNISEYSNLVPLAAAIRQQIGPDDCLQIYPDDEATANLYYLLGCHPSRYWVLHYPWLLLPRVRAQNLDALMEQPPAWIAYFPGRWNAEANAPELFEYIESHYERTVEVPWQVGQVWLMRRR